MATNLVREDASLEPSPFAYGGGGDDAKRDDEIPPSAIKTQSLGVASCRSSDWALESEDDEVELVARMFSLPRRDRAPLPYRAPDSLVAPWHNDGGRCRFVPTFLLCMVLLGNVGVVVVYQSNAILGLNRSTSESRAEAFIEPQFSLSVSPRARKLHAAESYTNTETGIENMVVFGGIVNDEILGDVWHYEEDNYKGVWRKNGEVSRVGTYDEGGGGSGIGAGSGESGDTGGQDEDDESSSSYRDAVNLMSRFGHTASKAVVNSTEYIFLYGGKSLQADGAYFYFSELLRFDPNANTMSIMETPSTGKHPPGRYGHAAAVLKNRLYILGGVGQGCQPQFECQDFWSFDLTAVGGNSTWEHLGNPGGRFFTSAGAITLEGRNETQRDQDFIITFGGYQSDSEGSRTFATDVQYYNIEAGYWGKVNILNERNTPQARWGHKLVYSSDKHLFKLFGGLSSDVVDGYNDMWTLSLRLDQTGSVEGEWEHLTALAQPPLPRFGHSFVDVSGSYYIYGGSRVDAVLGELWKYHVGNNTWMFVTNSNAEYYSNQHCFIATAAFGSGLHTNLYILRQFRDQVLMKFYLGRILVDYYYNISPPIAEWMLDKPLVRWVARGLLWPVVATVVRPLEGMSVLACLVASLLFLLAWRKTIQQVRSTMLVCSY